MSARSYLTLAAAAEGELEVKRSRFLARVEPVRDEREARAVIAAARRRHWDARHHCSGLVLGPDGDTRRSNDDGEPAGTAGAPILDALLGAGLSDVVAVVTRWFGGTRLGTGGLARAYGLAVHEAVNAAPTRRRELVERVRLHAPARRAGRLEHDLRAQGYLVEAVEYAAQAALTVAVPADRLEDVAALLARVTSGAGRLVRLGSAWVDPP